MIAQAYLDASVLLRIVLRQTGVLREWHEIGLGVSSALVVTECLRALDRFRTRSGLPDEEFAERRSYAKGLLDEINLLELDQAVLERAAQPMPTELGTLDAIHLATALLWREASGSELALATHDRLLGIAARAHGLAVIGL